MCLPARLGVGQSCPDANSRSAFARADCQLSFCVELAVATLLGLEGTRASAGAAAVTTTPAARVAAKPGATRRRTKEGWIELRPVPRPFLTPKDRLTARTVLTASHTHSLDSPGVETTSVEPRDVGGADPGVPRDVGGADPGVPRDVGGTDPGVRSKMARTD